jgi:hypothetical protein
MIEQPTTEEQMKSIDEKLKEKKLNKKPRGRKPRNSPVRSVMIPDPFRKWPTIHVQKHEDQYIPICFTSHKLMWIMKQFNLSQDLINVLTEIGVNVSIKEKDS